MIGGEAMMTDETIRAGDLVIIVHADCEFCLHQLGQIHRVLSIDYLRPTCVEGSWLHKKWHNYRLKYQKVARFSPTFGVPLPWLKRIPPLSELETVTEALETMA